MESGVRKSIGITTPVRCKWNQVGKARLRGGDPGSPLPQGFLKFGAWFRVERMASLSAARGVHPQSRCPRRGKGYVVGIGMGSPKSPGCLPFLHPRSHRCSARSQNPSPAVPASVPRSTRSWCRGGTWREAAPWAEVRALCWCNWAELGRVGEAPTNCAPLPVGRNGQNSPLGFTQVWESKFIDCG